MLILGRSQGHQCGSAAPWRAAAGGWLGVSAFSASLSARTPVSVVRGPLPSPSSVPHLSPFLPCTLLLGPALPILFLPSASPDLPLPLLTHQFLLLSSPASLFHPPSPNCASFCLVIHLPFRHCRRDHRNISEEEGG